MRNLVLFISLALLAAAAPLLAVDGSWQILGPDGGPVYDLAFQTGNPQVMYASVSGGVYKSRDGGATWAWSGTGLEQLSHTFNVAVDAVRPETVYAAQSAGVYRSLNGGETWRYMRRPTAYAVAAHPRLGGRVFAATESGLYRSANGGDTWTPLTQGLPASHRAALVLFDPSSERRLYASIQNANTQEWGIFQSTDGGVKWRPIHSGPLRGRRTLSLAVDPRAPQTLYAGTEGGGLYKSTNGGVTWRGTGFSDGFIWALKAHPRLSGVVYAGTGTGLFRSQDGGATWTLVSQGLPAGEGVSAIAFSPASAQTIYAGVATLFEQGGVFKSVNGGRSWAFSSRGTSGLLIESIAVNPDDPETLWVIGNTVLFRSTDRGRSWTRMRPGHVRAKRVAVHPLDGSIVYVMLPDGSMRRTRDGGQTWEAIGNPDVAPFGNATIVIDPQTPSTIYAAGSGIVKSTDGGMTWTRLSGEPADMGVFDLEIAPSSPSTLYGTGGGGSAGARVVRSTDGGATWTRIEQGLPIEFSRPVFHLAVDPLVSTTVYGIFDEKIYKTADGGASWSVFSDDDIFPEHSLAPLGISPFPSGLLYVGVGTGWVDEIEPEGSRERLGTSLRRALYTVFAVDPTDPCRIYAGTSSWGLLAFTRSGTAECN